MVESTRPAAFPGQKVGRELERIDVIPVEDFASRFIDRSRPVIIQGLVESWPAYRLWERPYLAAALAALDIPLTEKRKDGTGRIAGVHKIRGSDVAPILIDGRVDLPHFYLAQIRMPETVAGDITLPPYVPSSAASAPNLWIGPRGSLTPLHHDGFHNIVAEIRGRKRFTLFAPEDEPYLYCTTRDPPQPNTSQVDPRNPDLERFPLFANATPYVLVLEPGEALYIPLAWFHLVEGLEPSVSVNFWWRPHFKEALQLGLPERKRAMGFDHFETALKSLCVAYDMGGLDLFDVAGCLLESGRLERGAQVVYELVDRITNLAAERLNDQAPTERLAVELGEMDVADLSQNWEPKWTPCDRSRVRANLDRLRVAGPPLDWALLDSFLEQPGGDDGSFETHCAREFDLAHLLSVLRDAAERLGLRAAFMPPQFAIPTDMAFRSFAKE